MSCPTCKNKGYIESHIIKDSSNQPLTLRCPQSNCPYTDRYYSKISGTQPAETPNKTLLSDLIDSFKDSIGIGKTEYYDYGTSKATSKNIGTVKPLDPPQDKEVPESNQATSNVDPRKVEAIKELESTFPYLDSAIFDKLLDMHPDRLDNIRIVIDTPFGPKDCSSLREANRVVMMLSEYDKNVVELNYADSIENVIVFPIVHALGIQA